MEFIRALCESVDGEIPPLVCTDHGKEGCCLTVLEPIAPPAMEVSDGEVSDGPGLEYEPPSPTPPYIEETDSWGNPPNKEPEVTEYSAIEPPVWEADDQDDSSEDEDSSDSSVVELPIIEVTDDDWGVTSAPPKKKTQAQLEEETRAWAEICKRVRRKKMLDYARKKRDLNIMFEKEKYRLVKRDREAKRALEEEYFGKPKRYRF